MNSVAFIAGRRIPAKLAGRPALPLLILPITSGTVKAQAPPAASTRRHSARAHVVGRATCSSVSECTTRSNAPSSMRNWFEGRTRETARGDGRGGATSQGVRVPASLTSRTVTCLAVLLDTRESSVPSHRRWRSSASASACDLNVAAAVRATAALLPVDAVDLVRGQFPCGNERRPENLALHGAQTATHRAGRLARPHDGHRISSRDGLHRNRSSDRQCQAAPPSGTRARREPSDAERAWPASRSATATATVYSPGARIGMTKVKLRVDLERRSSRATPHLCGARRCSRRTAPGRSRSFTRKPTIGFSNPSSTRHITRSVTVSPPATAWIARPRSSARVTEATRRAASPERTATQRLHDCRRTIRRCRLDNVGSGDRVRLRRRRPLQRSPRGRPRSLLWRSHPSRSCRL